MLALSGTVGKEGAGCAKCVSGATRIYTAESITAAKGASRLSRGANGLRFQVGAAAPRGAFCPLV